MTLNHDEDSDETYIEEKIREHALSVYRLALNRLHNSADAEDVTQTVFIRLYTSLPDFKNSEHEKAWLFRVTINCCKDMHRSSWRRMSDFSEDGKIAATQELAKEAMSSHIADDNRQAVFAHLEKALNTLSEKQRTAIHLFYFEDLSVGEISEITGEPQSTIRSHLRRARKKLKKELEDKHEF